MSRLESSNWLTHVQTCLNTACLVAQCLDQEGMSVLVHGASGLDSTLLVTSVAQVILNPDCRTVRGNYLKYLQSYSNLNYSGHSIVLVKTNPVCVCKFLSSKL